MRPELEYHPYVLSHLEPVLKLQDEHKIVTESYGPLTVSIPQGSLEKAQLLTANSSTFNHPPVSYIFLHSNPLDIARHSQSSDTQPEAPSNQSSTKSQTVSTNPTQAAFLSIPPRSSCCGQLTKVSLLWLRRETLRIWRRWLRLRNYLIWLKRILRRLMRLERRFIIDTMWVR